MEISVEGKFPPKFVSLENSHENCDCDPQYETTD